MMTPWTADRLLALDPTPLLATALRGGVRAEGKVRDRYDLADGRALLVATDRFSAFDRVLGAIPLRGQVLTELAAWWFAATADIIANHLLEQVDPRAMLVRKAEILPVEVVVRGFLTGVTDTSLWTLYQRGEAHRYGLDLPAGMGKGDPLPRPVITPTTKAAAGHHDQPLAASEVVGAGLCDARSWSQICEAALALFARGQQRAAAVGLTLVDTKYEFGRIGGRIVLCDEVHTPDSSRFWRWPGPGDVVAAGAEPPSLSKEFLRTWLVERGFAGDGAAPPLPKALLAEAASRYIAVREALIGDSFVPEPPGDGAARLQTALDRCQGVGSAPAGGGQR